MSRATLCMILLTFLGCGFADDTVPVKKRLPVPDKPKPSADEPVVHRPAEAPGAPQPQADADTSELWVEVRALRTELDATRRLVDKLEEEVAREREQREEWENVHAEDVHRQDLEDFGAGKLKQIPARRP